MSADLPRDDFDASIKALLGSLFSGVEDRPESAPCPNCNADVALSAARSVVCESCGAKLVSTRHLSFRHYSVIAQYAPKSSMDYWIRRAAGENLSPARLGAEIKYTARQYVYGSKVYKRPAPQQAGDGWHPGGYLQRAEGGCADDRQAGLLPPR